MSRTAARIRVGISGWRHAPWRGTFYPEKLPQRSELEYASGRVSVIEINASFYSLQKPESYSQWYAQTPEDFVFSIKGPRYITHLRRLVDVRKPLANFMASGLFNLREKLGPILWQFPPNFIYRADRTQAFLELLPVDFEGAALLGRQRDPFMTGRSRLAYDRNRPMRHAIEVRNASFLDRSFIDLLRQHQVAAVIAESARGWPRIEDITADFLYLRLHGDKAIERGGYKDRALTRWARRIAQWHDGGEPKDARKVIRKQSPTRQSRDVYCFFDGKDVKLRAPFDAQSLSTKLGLEAA